MGKPPGARTSGEICYIARNVLSHHVAFQLISALSLERIASRMVIKVASGGEVGVEMTMVIMMMTTMMTTTTMTMMMVTITMIIVIVPTMAIAMTIAMTITTIASNEQRATSNEQHSVAVFGKK